MFILENTVLIIVDVQGKLAQLMHNKEALFEGLKKIIKGAKVLEIPIIWVEQNPKGLGPTIPEVAELLTDIKPISKVSFSCLGKKGFVSRLKELNRKQVLIAGIETHICVYQTTIGLLNSGYEVEVITDAVSSRIPENKNIGIEKMKTAGAGVTSVETALFELLKVAEGPKLKEVLKIVK
jgi:nicotinamidase-related amidase